MLSHGQSALSGLEVGIAQDAKPRLSTAVIPITLSSNMDCHSGSAHTKVALEPPRKPQSHPLLFHQYQVEFSGMAQMQAAQKGAFQGKV